MPDKRTAERARRKARGDKANPALPKDELRHTDPSVPPSESSATRARDYPGYAQEDADQEPDHE